MKRKRSREPKEQATKRSRRTQEKPNKLDHEGPVYTDMNSFVEALVSDEGKRFPIRSILVSTNGIAAVKWINSIRKKMKTFFGDDRIVKFFCLNTEQEIAFDPKHLKLADHICISAGDNGTPYTDVEKIVFHAVEQEVDAVFAGWGHASENPELPRLLAERNICFIGPPCNPMYTLGDKIASTIISQTLDIPTIAWSGSGLKIDLSHQTDGEVFVSQELFEMATVEDFNEALRSAQENEIGYPLMIKASEGSGGEGIRKCTNDADFKENFIQVQTEVPGSPIFLMEYVENARHIEVQLIADRYGCVIPVGTRDCSIQRRRQKIIVESPACITPKETLVNMQEDAVKIARLLGYESVGTVEYLFLPDKDLYFFLEFNPRLEVENPCTEMIARINIPGIQIQIAMGIPLHRISDIRSFYGFKDDELYENTPLPVNLVKLDVKHHCIAVRFTPEEPEDFFGLPIGSVDPLDFPSSKHVWGYFSVSSSGRMHEFADSQFGHLFAVGSTRLVICRKAVSRLLGALQVLKLCVAFQSQVSYLIDLLKEPDFTDNKINTQWLDIRIAEMVLPEDKSPLRMHEMIAFSSAVIGHSRISSAFNMFKAAVERGQLLPSKELTDTTLFDLVKKMNIYKVTVTRSGPINYFISLNGGTTPVEVRALGDGGTLVTHNGVSHVCHLEETSDQFRLIIGTSLVVFNKNAGPAIVKTIHKRLERIREEEYLGKHIDTPKLFPERFPEWVVDITETEKYNRCYDACLNVLNGSIPPESGFCPDVLVEELFKHLESNTLPHALLKHAISPVMEHLPKRLANKIKRAAGCNDISKFVAIRNMLDQYFAQLQPNECDLAKAACRSLYTTCQSFAHGTWSRTAYVLNSLLSKYRNCEKFFEGTAYEDAVALLFDEFGSNMEGVVQMIYSHTRLKKKNKLMTTLLRKIESKGMHLVTPLSENLREISIMYHTDDTCEQSRYLLLNNNRTKYRNIVNQAIWDIENVSLPLRESAEVLPVDSAVSRLRFIFEEMMGSGVSPKELLEKSPWIHKVIHEFFFDQRLADFVIRAFMERHFPVGDGRHSALFDNSDKVAVYDFGIDLDSLYQITISPGEKTYQLMSFIRLTVHEEHFSEAVTSRNLIDALIFKFAQIRLKPEMHLGLTLLVKVVQKDQPFHTVTGNRDAQLEELPALSASDAVLADKAAKSSSLILDALKEKLHSLLISAEVIVCIGNKPLMQAALPEAAHLELWRLPATSQRVSKPMFNIDIYKYDDELEKYSSLYVRELVEIPLRKEDEDKEKRIKDVLANHLDNVCGALNLTKRTFNKFTFGLNYAFLYVTFPCMPKEFSYVEKTMIDAAIRSALYDQDSNLHNQRVYETEIVLSQMTVEGVLAKHRIVSIDRHVVVPPQGSPITPPTEYSIAPLNSSPIAPAPDSPRPDKEKEGSDDDMDGWDELAIAVFGSLEEFEKELAAYEASTLVMDGDLQHSNEEVVFEDQEEHPDWETVGPQVNETSSDEDEMIVVDDSDEEGRMEEEGVAKEMEEPLVVWDDDLYFGHEEVVEEEEQKEAQDVYQEPQTEELKDAKKDFTLLWNTRETRRFTRNEVTRLNRLMLTIFRLIISHNPHLRSNQPPFFDFASHQWLVPESDSIPAVIVPVF